MIKILGLILLLFVVFSGFSQKNFKGTIFYEIQYLDNDIDTIIKKSLPKKFEVSYQDKQTRTVLKNELGSSVLIANAETGTTTVLFDIKGQKFAIVNNKQDRESLVKAIPETLIKFTDQTKKILGYNCKKAELYQDDKVLEAWYTDEIEIQQVNWFTQFKHIKGVMLEYTQKANGLENRYVAKSIKKEKLKSKVFEIPSDYQIVTKSEFDNFVKEQMSEVEE